MAQNVCAALRVRPLLLRRGLAGVRGLASGGAEPISPAAHCEGVVRSGDYDGYLCSLLLGNSNCRSAALALRAFNLETAAIKDAVRGHVVPGQMRMQFWRDSVDEVFRENACAGPPAEGAVGDDLGRGRGGAAPPQPVVQALADAVARHGLTKRWFDRLLDARSADLETQQASTVRDLETYAENTASSLLYLMLEVAGVRGDPRADHAASHVGKALGVCTLLRGIAHHAARRSSVIPSEVMRKNALYSSALFEGPRSPEEAHALAECVYEVASAAKAHMDAAQELINPGGGGAAAEQEGGGGGHLLRRPSGP